MIKHILTSVAVNALTKTLCDSKKKPELFDNDQNLINANGILCGAVKSFSEEGGNLILENVVFDKYKIAEIFSGGFVCKPAQRIGMDLTINKDGINKTFNNVWIDDMSEYKESRETITISKMICQVEVREAPVESTEWQYQLLANEEVIGTFYKASLFESATDPKITFDGIKLDNKKIKNIFKNASLNTKSQRVPLQLICKFNGKITFTVNNIWIETLSNKYSLNNFIFLQKASAIAESYSDLNQIIK